MFPGWTGPEPVSCNITSSNSGVLEHEYVFRDPPGDWFDALTWALVNRLPFPFPHGMLLPITADMSHDVSTNWFTNMSGSTAPLYTSLGRTLTVKAIG